MKNRCIILLLLIFIGFSFNSFESKVDLDHQVKIKWTEKLEGDFSFKEKWSYPEFVYKNRFGQLSCDGDCPIEIDRMQDASGKIYEDSLQAFYKIIDTTHIAHSLKSENRMYEYFRTDFIEFEKQKDGTIKGASLTNVSTHSKLVMEIQGDYCSAWVDFNSIRDLGQHTFPLKEGSITIDKSLFEEGIVKAEFDFKFKNTIDSEEKLFWKGQIYALLK